MLSAIKVSSIFPGRIILVLKQQMLWAEGHGANVLPVNYKLTFEGGKKEPDATMVKGKERIPSANNKKNKAGE